MKVLASTAALIAAALLAPAALAADSRDRTTMPSECSERDVNCVVKDGPPRRRGAAVKPPEKEKEKRGNTPPGTDRAGGGPASGAIVDPAGVTRK